MTLHDEIRRIGLQLIALADATGHCAPAMPGRDATPDQFLTTSVAAKRWRVSQETVRRHARRYGFGAQIQTGSWRFSKRQGDEFYAQRKQDDRFDAFAAFGATPLIETTATQAHDEISSNRQDKK